MGLKGFFITGTDTGVGKTAVAASLVYLMNARGIRTAPVKPVQTGLPPEASGDLELCLRTAGLEASPAELERMNPYRLRAAASPHLAAEIEGTRIELERIVSGCRELSGTYEALVVESAGGLLVPLTRETVTLELARRLGLPLLIVARAGLGTINHSLLTVRTAKAEGLTVAAVVLNRPEPAITDRFAEILIADNRRIIESLGGVPVWEALPHIPGAGSEPVPTRRLAESLAAAGADGLIRSLRSA
jgi:dethiobiotin synthetase